jgi:hypothetical protein
VFINETNLRVRNCRICHLKSLHPLALLIVLFLRRYRRCNFNHGGIGMNNRLFNCLIAGTLATALAVASPALGRGGGGGGGGHAGGMGGGGHVGGMGGGMHASGMGGGARFGGMGSSGTHFSGGRFAAASFAHPGFSHRSARLAFRDRDHDRFHDRFHHRFHHRFFGGSFAYAGYDSCWRRTWTPYGLQWVDVCSDYSY